MATIFDYIKNIRNKYLNRDVREDMAKALETLVARITGLQHNSGASNLVEYPSGTTELNGITYEVTDEGIHVYGTATAASWLPLDWGKSNLTAGQHYIGSLGKTGAGTVYLSLGYFMDAGQETYASIGATEGTTSFLCPSQYVSSRNMIYVPIGSTVNAYVNPRLRLANAEDTSQPDIYTIEEISEKIHSGSIGGGKGVKKAQLASQMTDADLIYLYVGSEPNYSNGYWYYHNGSAFVRGAQFYLGLDGQDGADGADGLTPYVGQNGNWFIGNADTGVVARATAVDEDARDSIAALQESETDLDTRVTALEQEGAAYTWTEAILNTTYGATFSLRACPGLGLFTLDMFGTWSSVPNTSGAWVSLGQNDVFKYAEGRWSDSYKTHFQFSKNYKAEIYIAPNGTVYFGQTAELSTNNNVKVTKGAGCRAKFVWPLPSVFAPIEEEVEAEP